MQASLADENQQHLFHRNRFIDVCRGVAILGVMFHHYFFATVVQSFSWPSASFTTKALASLNNGWLGVNLFFVLSGWVLYRPSSDFNNGKASEFYSNRARRLLPLLFVFISILALVDQKDFFLFLKSCALILTGINNFIPSEWAPIHLRYALWSISVEILFSATLPILIYVSNKIGFWRFFWTVIVFCLFYRTIADIVWFRIDPDFTNKLINPLKDNLIGRMDDFVIGMGIAKFIQEGRLIQKRFIFLALSALALTCFGWTFIWYAPRTIAVSCLASTLHLVFSISVFVIAIISAKHLLWQSRFCSPLVFMGTVCYSAYLTHTTIIKAFFYNGATVESFVLFSITTFVISAILFSFFESSTIKHVPRCALMMRQRLYYPYSPPVAVVPEIEPGR